jgi:hypothetical protein
MYIVWFIRSSFQVIQNSNVRLQLKKNNLKADLAGIRTPAVYYLDIDSVEKPGKSLCRYKSMALLVMLSTNYSELLNNELHTSLSLKKRFSTLLWRCLYLFNSEIRVRRDDRSTRKINSFSRKISSESALFSLQSLNETTRKLFWRLVCGNARQLTVEVKSALKLQKIPVILK